MIKHYIVRSGSLDDAASRTSDKDLVDLLNEIDLPQGGGGIIRYADEDDTAPLALFDDEYDNVIPRKEADGLISLAGEPIVLEELVPASSRVLTKEMAHAFRDTEDESRYNLKFDGVTPEGVDVVAMMVDNVLDFDDVVAVSTYDETSWGAFLSARSGVYVLRPNEFETVFSYLKW